MTEPLRKSCFGLFNGNTICQGCKAQKRCKAVTATDGLEIIAAVIEEMTESLKPGEYKDTDRMFELVNQLLDPPRPSNERTQAQESVLSMIQRHLDGKRNDPNPRSTHPLSPSMKLGQALQIPQKDTDLFDDL